MKWQKEKPVIAVTGSSNRINRLTITQFNVAEFFTDGNRFQKTLAGLTSDDVPYRCVYCREDFTGCGVWMAFFDAREILIDIHIAFSCKTCHGEMKGAKPHKASKMRARALRNLFSIIKNSEVKSDEN